MIRLPHIHGAVWLAHKTVRRKRQVNRFRRLLRFDPSRNRLPIPFANRQTAHTLKTSLLSAIRMMAPPPSCALAHERGPCPGNDGLLRGDHADVNLPHIRHLRWSGHLLRRSDFRWHPHDVRAVPGRHSRAFRRAVWSRSVGLGSRLDRSCPKPNR